MGTARLGLYRHDSREETPMKKTRGGRMTAAKARAAKAKGGKGRVSKRKAGSTIMKT